MFTRRPPLLVGVVAAALGVALTTLLVFALRDVAPVLSLGVVYLLDGAGRGVGVGRLARRWRRRC